MRLPKIRSAAAVSVLPFLGCFQLLGPGGGEPPLTIPKPKGYEYFDPFTVIAVSQTGYHRESVSAGKALREGSDGKPDSAVELRGGAIWGSRVTARVEFRNAYRIKAPESAITLMARDRDRNGIALVDSQIAWEGCQSKPGHDEWCYATVTYAFRGPAWLHAAMKTPEGRAESVRAPVAREPSWLADVPMPEAEGDSLLRPFQGDWALAARNTSCYEAKGDSLVYGPSRTVWAGTPGLPPRALRLDGRAATAGEPDSAARDTVLFFTEGRFRSRDPFLDPGSPNPGGRFYRPVSWSGSPETFVLTRYEGGATTSCRVDWIFARGATLDRLRGAP